MSETRERFNRVLSGAWVLVESYYPSRYTAQCPALQWNRRRGVWLTLPEDKSRNSWRWLCVRFAPSGPIHALRWTMPEFGSSASGAERSTCAK